MRYLVHQLTKLKQLNDYIIEGKNNGYDFPALKGHYRSYPMCVYDAKTSTNGLKTLEAYLGLNIHETSVPFNLDRPLTPKEKREVIDYCKDDVAATSQVLKLERNKFKAHWLLLRKSLTYLGSICLKRWAVTCCNYRWSCQR